jgi:hypothetical protein
MKVIENTFLINVPNMAILNCFLSIIILFSFFLQSCQQPSQPTYDVVVYGGTSAGVIA